MTALDPGDFAYDDEQRHADTTGPEVERDPHAPVGADHVEAALLALGAHGSDAVGEATVYRTAQAIARAARARRPLPSTAPPAFRQAIREALDPTTIAHSSTEETIDYVARVLDVWFRDLIDDARAEEYDEAWNGGRDALARTLRRALDDEVGTEVEP